MFLAFQLTFKKIGKKNKLIKYIVKINKNSLIKFFKLRISF